MKSKLKNEEKQVEEQLLSGTRHKEMTKHIADNNRQHIAYDR